MSLEGREGKTRCIADHRVCFTSVPSLHVGVEGRGGLTGERQGTGNAPAQSDVWVVCEGLEALSAVSELLLFKVKDR